MAIVDSSAVEALTNINTENWVMWAQDEEPGLYRARVHGSRTEDLHAAARQLAADVHRDNAEVVRVHDDVARAKEVARALHECDEQLRELRAAMPSGVRGATLQRGERERLRLEIAQVEGRRSVWEQESTRTGDADIGMALLSAHRAALGMSASELRERTCACPATIGTSTKRSSASATARRRPAARRRSEFGEGDRRVAGCKQRIGWRSERVSKLRPPSTEGTAMSPASVPPSAPRTRQRAIWDAALKPAQRRAQLGRARLHKRERTTPNGPRRAVAWLRRLLAWGTTVLAARVS